MTQIGRAWLWAWGLGILLDFPVVALEIGSLPGRGEVEGQPSLSSSLLEAFMKASLVFRVGRERGGALRREATGTRIEPWLCQGPRRKEILPRSQVSWKAGAYLAKSGAYCLGT